MPQGIAVKRPTGICAACRRPSGDGIWWVPDQAGVRVCDGERSVVMRAAEFNLQASTPGTWVCEKVIPIMEEDGAVVRSKS